MKQLTILVGPPGSGKSTLAWELTQPKNGGYYRINQDDQGKKGHWDAFTPILHTENNIVIDRMNFNKQQREKYLSAAKKHGYKTKIIVLHENQSTCLSRMKDRKDHPTITTEEQARSALNTFFTKYEKPTKDEADEIEFVYPKLSQWPWSTIIVDIDGTLSNTDHRQKFMAGPKKDWPGFFGAMHLDPVNEPIKKLTNTMRTNNVVCIVSGRPDNYRDVTTKWLDDNKIFYDHVFMRPRNDSRADTIIKEIILDFELRTRYTILMSVDDRQCVVKMWRDNGVTCLDVAGPKGDF